MLIYESLAQAAQSGWAACSGISEERYNNGLYSLEASRKMGIIRRIAQTLFVKFFSLTTCGKALNNEKVRHWQNEVREGKVIKTIYVRTFVNQQDVANLAEAGLNLFNAWLNG